MSHDLRWGNTNQMYTMKYHPREMFKLCWCLIAASTSSIVRWSPTSITQPVVASSNKRSAAGCSSAGPEGAISPVNRDLYLRCMLHRPLVCVSVSLTCVCALGSAAPLFVLSNERGGRGAWLCPPSTMMAVFVCLWDSVESM
jgi:hypothetical protein